MVAPAIIAGGLGLLGSILGRPKAPVVRPGWKDVRDNLHAAARGARVVGKKFGFNPLTLLEGAMGGMGNAGSQVQQGTPPLASAMSFLSGFVTENFGDEANTRKEHNKLQNELLALEVQRAKSLNRVASPSMLQGSSLNGGRVVMQQTGPVRAATPLIGPRLPVMVRNGLNGNWITLDAGVADRLRLKAGETMIGEDNEALFGDLVSEGVNVGSTVTGETTGQAPIVEIPKPKKPPEVILPGFKWPKRY